MNCVKPLLLIFVKQVRQWLLLMMLTTMFAQKSSSTPMTITNDATDVTIVMTLYAIFPFFLYFLLCNCPVG